ncbi:Uncharacterised protein [uncultured Clostridium sp.]|nr:Uncharacterised protein [uncultured Clostridium sp.]
MEPGCIEWMQLQKKKQGQTNFFEIHLTLLHIFYVLFHSDTWMSLGGTRTNGLFSSHQESPSCPPENRPSGTRKNQASFPFYSGNPTTFSSIFNFQFSDSMTSASVSASKPLLPLFHSAISLSLINQAFFLFSRSFSGLEKELGRAWEWDACEGDRGKKRSRARRISLKFI